MSVQMNQFSKVKKNNNKKIELAKKAKESKLLRKTQLRFSIALLDSEDLLQTNSSADLNNRRLQTLFKDTVFLPSMSSNLENSKVLIMTIPGELTSWSGILTTEADVQGVDTTQQVFIRIFF